MANPIKSFKKSLGQIPTRYRYLTSLGILAALLIALPVTLIGLMSGTFELRKRAVTYEPGPTPTLGPGQVRIYAGASSGHPIGEEGVITISLNNDSQNNLDMIQLFMTFDPRVITFSDSDVELWMGGVTTIKEVFHVSSDKAQLRLVHQFDINPSTTIVFIRYKPVASGVSSLVFENDLKTGTLENKVTAAGSDANIIEEIINSSVTITGSFDRCGDSCSNSNDCDGLVCGTPCPEGEVCAPNLRCYNAVCPFDQDCNCFNVTPTISPTPTPSTPTGGPISSSIFFKIRFGGVTSRPIDDSSKNLKIYATSLTGGPDLGSADNKLEVPFMVDDAGIYSMEIGLDGSYFGRRYRLRIKGPKHLQSVFPDVYFQPRGEIDLTYAPLRPGDLDQDGKVDINDLRAIKVFSTNPADIAFGDLNFDNRVDIFDRVLVLGTLSVQYDPD